MDLELKKSFLSQNYRFGDISIDGCEDEFLEGEDKKPDNGTLGIPTLRG